MEDLLNTLIGTKDRVWNISCDGAPESSFGKHILHTRFDPLQIPTEILFISADLVVISGTAESFPDNSIIDQLLEKYKEVIICVPYNLQEIPVDHRIEHIYAFPKQHVKYLFIA